MEGDRLINATVSYQLCKLIWKKVCVEVMFRKTLVGRDGGSRDLGKK